MHSAVSYERPFSIPFTSACNHTNSFSQHSLLKTDLLVLGRGGHNLAFPVPCSSEKGLQWVRVIRWIGVCLSNYGVNYWSILSTIERDSEPYFNVAWSTLGLLWS